MWFHLEKSLIWEKFEKFCLDNRVALISQLNFERDREHFISLKSDLLLKFERNQKKMLENTLDFNKDLLRVIINF